jgi:hypothetical protein
MIIVQAEVRLGVLGKGGEGAYPIIRKGTVFVKRKKMEKEGRKRVG